MQSHKVIIWIPKSTLLLQSNLLHIIRGDNVQTVGIVDNDGDDESEFK